MLVHLFLIYHVSTAMLGIYLHLKLLKSLETIYHNILYINHFKQHIHNINELFIVRVYVLS